MRNGGTLEDAAHPGIVALCAVATIALCRGWAFTSLHPPQAALGSGSPDPAKGAASVFVRRIPLKRYIP